MLPVNMLDPIWKCFGYGPLAARIRLDRICWIRFSRFFSVLVFQRRHGPYCAKPSQIRSGWPGQGLAKLSWSESKPVCRNHWAQFLAGCNWPATSFPFSDSVALQNQPESDLVLADCARFWPNGSGPEASQRTGTIRPASGQYFPADLAQMQMGSGMFTGLGED